MAPDAMMSQDVFVEEDHQLFLKTNVYELSGAEAAKRLW